MSLRGSALPTTLATLTALAILNFAQAQDKEARAHMVRRVHAAQGVVGPLTVQVAVERYLEFLETNRKGAVDARYRANAHIYPDARQHRRSRRRQRTCLRKWHAGLAKNATTRADQTR